VSQFVPTCDLLEFSAMDRVAETLEFLTRLIEHFGQAFAGSSPAIQLGVLLIPAALALFYRHGLTFVACLVLAATAIALLSIQAAHPATIALAASAGAYLLAARCLTSHRRHAELDRVVAVLTQRVRQLEVAEERRMMALMRSTRGSGPTKSSLAEDAALDRSAQ
jgi:hypothetical protein